MAIRMFCHKCETLTNHSSSGECWGCSIERDKKILAAATLLPLEDRVAALERAILQLQRGPERY